MPKLYPARPSTFVNYTEGASVEHFFPRAEPVAIYLSNKAWVLLLS